MWPSLLSRVTRTMSKSAAPLSILRAPASIVSGSPERPVDRSATHRSCGCDVNGKARCGLCGVPDTPCVIAWRQAEDIGSCVLSMAECYRCRCGSLNDGGAGAAWTKVLPCPADPTEH